MASSGPAGSNVRALLQQLCAGEVVDGGAIMLAVARLKDTRARAELVAAAREHAPNLSLTTPSFHILVDLFRVCLREANNVSDFKIVRSVFNLAYQYAMHNGADTFFVGRLIQSHEAWKNIHFWLFCAEELIRYDILRFTYWIQRNPSYPVLPLEEPLFIATVVIIRLQAIVFDSMQAVRVPAWRAAKVAGCHGVTGSTHGLECGRKTVSATHRWPSPSRSRRSRRTTWCGCRR